MSRNIAFVVEYDGKNFCGWQDQPDVRTIQRELRRAIEMVTRQPISHLAASGRTDSGVHAKGQVVSFRTDSTMDLDALAYSVSGVLRDEVAVVAASEMPLDFHPRKSALRKRYSYKILYRNCPPVLDAGRVWHLRGPLNIERMKREASTLIGVHDFKSFQGTGCAAKTSAREIYVSEVVEEPPYVIYNVEGEGFLKQMVRNIVGTLVAMSRNTMTLSMEELLHLRDRRRAGITAPAQGLTLQWVRYEERFMSLLTEAASRRRDVQVR